MNVEAIKEGYKNLSREELIAELIRTNAQLRIEKCQSSWLDRLADELRDGDDSDESDELYTEYKEMKKSLRKELDEKYGIDL